MDSERNLGEKQEARMLLTLDSSIKEKRMEKEDFSGKMGHTTKVTL